MSRPILFVDHAPALGGAERSLLLLMHHLDREKWQPHLACVDGKLAEAACQQAIPIHKLNLPQLRRSPKAGLNWMASARTLANVANKIEATAIYSNTIRASMYAAMASTLARKPFVWHMRDFWLSENEPENKSADTLIKKLLINRATLVITNSHAVAAALPPSPKIQVVHNGIDLMRFDPAIRGQEYRDEWGFSADTIVVGMMGRLKKWKGQDRFLQVAAKVSQRRPDVRFVIIGGAPFGDPDGFAAELHALTDNLSLRETVAFAGHLENTPAALAALDIFVHPGEPEPFGLVNIEAMAMEKPVVAFGHGALPEIVTDETGILTPPRDVDEMAKVLVKLVDDGEKRGIFGRNGRERVKNQFTIQQVASGVSQHLTVNLPHE